MPPDRSSRRTPQGIQPRRSEASIPLGPGAKTWEVRDSQVNLQLGLFIAVPFVGVVLVFGPNSQAWALAALPALLTSLHGTRLRYRRLSIS